MFKHKSKGSFIIQCTCIVEYFNITYHVDIFVQLGAVREDNPGLRTHV